MSPWAFLLPLAAFATTAAVIRVIRTTRSSAWSATIAMVGLALFFLLNAEPVYLAVDPVIGGHNVTYLIAIMLYLVSIYFYKVAFLPAGRLTGGSSWARIDTWLLFAVLAGVVFLFTISSTPVTSYRLATYYDQPSVVAFSQLPLIYYLGCGLLIVQQASDLVRYRMLSLLGQLGAVAVIVAYVPGSFVAIVRLAFAGSSVADPRSLWYAIDVIGVITSSALCIIGMGLLFLRRRRPRRPQSLGDLDLLASPAAAIPS